MPSFTIMTLGGCTGEDYTPEVTTFRAYEACDPKDVPHGLLTELEEIEDRNTGVYIYEDDPSDWVLSTFSHEDAGTRSKGLVKCFLSIVEFELWREGKDVEEFRKRVKTLEDEREKLIDERRAAAHVVVPKVDIERVAREM